MTTPTREQIEAEFASFIEYPSEDKRYVTTVSCLLFAEHIARIAHTAGREQGLREAKEVVERDRVVEPSSTGDDYAAYDEAITECAAAIEQLRA